MAAKLPVLSITSRLRLLAAHRWSPWLLIGLLYLLCTLVVTYPAAFHLDTRLAGETTSGADVRESVWGIWWWKHALVDLRVSPLSIPVLDYPVGQSFPLYPLMSQTFLLALPLAALRSPVFAYNVVFLSSFVLSGVCGYALCLEVSSDRKASFVGGLIWAFFPARMAHALAGHLFLIVVFALPLAALMLLRVLRAPTWRNSLGAALAFTLAGTIHPIYLVYCVAPLTLVMVGHAWWTERRAFWQRGRLLALALALGLAAVAIGLLLYPALRESSRGPLWTPEGGLVALSADALAYFLPSAENPFIWSTPLARYATGLAHYSQLTYVGWLALALSILGAYTQRRESRPWLLLALGGGILALGPILKVGGQPVTIPIDGKPYSVLMPYAFIANLPLIQWSRTPSRLTVLVMLAVSVLAVLGARQLLQLTALKTRPILWIGLVSLIILAEYQVRFPFPTSSADVPAPIHALAAATPARAVVQLPGSSYGANQRALYWQTVHQLPLVGGRVYRTLPEVEQRQAFYRQLLSSPSAVPGLPLPTVEQRLAALDAAGIGWVVYDAAADSSGTVRRQLELLLGPAVSEDGQAALFQAPRADYQPGEAFWLQGEGWEAGLPDRHEAARIQQRGVIYLHEPQARAGRLSFGADLAAGTRRLSLWVNRQPAGRFVVGQAAPYLSEPIDFAQGLNVIEFVDEGQLGSQAASSPAGTVISNLRVVENLPPVATFEPALHLLSVALPGQARAGQDLTAYFVWRARMPVKEDLTLFAHLFGPAGELITQKDEPVLGEIYPTSQWQAGDILTSQVTLSLPADLPLGAYRLSIGLYRQPDAERLPVSGGNARDNVLPAGTIYISPALTPLARPP